MWDLQKYEDQTAIIDDQGTQVTYRELLDMHQRHWPQGCADRDVQDPRRSGQDHRSHPLLYQPGDLGLPAQDRGYEQVRCLRGYAEGWPVRS